MSFVPFIPPDQSSSARAQELGRRIREVIENFRREHPDLKVREIQQAMRIALMGASASSKSAALLLLGAVAAIGGLFVFFFSYGGENEGRLPVIAIAVLVAFIGLVFVKLRNRT